MADQVVYYAVKYDALSLEADPDKENRPGRSRSYKDFSIEPPQPMEPGYTTQEEAEEYVKTLNEGAKKGEQVDIILANGEHYVGPRFIYVFAAGV